MTTEQMGQGAPSGRAGDAHQLDIRLFGPLRVLVDGVDLPLGSPKARALLAALALHNGSTVTTDRLVDMLWDGSAPRTAGHSLQVYVSRLRPTFVERLGHPLIETHGQGYRIECDPEELDVGRFEHWVAAAREALDRGSTAQAVTPLERALDAWEGTPFEDLASSGYSHAHVAWLEQERDWATEQLALTLSRDGSPDRALRLAELMLARDPLRELSQEAAMRALYRLGRAPEALRCFASYRATLADELGVDPSARLRSLHERMLVADPKLNPVRRVPPGLGHARPRNPYKGLRSFTEADAEDFFGREPIVDELMGRLRAGHRLVAVVGPSGSGKSSLLAAGLLPALRAAEATAEAAWAVALPPPGAYDVDVVEAAVNAARERTAYQGGASGHPRVVLVLDQFESAFQAGSTEAGQPLLDRLTEWAKADGDVTTVLAMRADYYDRPLHHAQFAPIFTAAVLPLVPLTAAQLEAAIVRPAVRAGIGVEASVLASLVAEVGPAGASLPLLQFVLADLFDRHTGRSLTAADYAAVGGVQAALSRRAEEMRAGFSFEEQRVLTQLCLRLFRFDGQLPTLRWMPVAELAALPTLEPESMAHVLAALNERRLVVMDSDNAGAPAVCLGHEAILTAWPWLANLTDHKRLLVRQHGRLVEALQEWELKDRHPDYLWRGERLKEFIHDNEVDGMLLSEPEQDFLHAAAARDLNEAQAAAATDRQVRHVRRAARRRLALLVASLVGLLVLAGVGATVVRDRPVRVAVADVWGGQIGSDVRVGVDRAAGQGGIEQVKASAGVTDGGKVTDALASAGAELVITSTLGADIPRIATSHPDTRFFAYADDSMPAVANVTWASFADQQTAYLAGAAAAMASRSGRVGFLGGADTPTLRRFEAGYVAGAHSAVPTVAVEVDYITHVPDYDGFSSPSLAADAARRMLQHGTDVVYAASGASQTGTFQAVIDMSVETHHQLWAIGADDDAWGDESWQRTATSRDHILTSTVKRFDLASDEAVQDFKAGTLQPGLRIYDVANGGLVLSVNGGHLDPYLARLNEISHSIVTGRTVVPCVPSGLSADEAKAAQRGVACGLP